MPVRRLGLLPILFCFLFFNQLNAQISSTAAGGPWNSTSTWVGGIIPGSGSNVIIVAGSTVTVNAPAGACQNLTISGNLNSNAGINLDVYGDWTNNGGFNPNTGSVTFRDPLLSMLGGSSASIFYNLISNTPVLNLNTNDVTVNHQLTLNGRLLLNNQDLILGASSLAINGTLGAANGMIVMNMGIGGGEVRKLFTANGSFTFPVGDVTGTVEYSPLTITFTGGTYAAGAYAGVKVINTKHPSNTNTSNYLNRYWSLSVSGVTTPFYNIDATYLTADVVGAESNMAMGRYTALPWVKYGAATMATNLLSTTAVNATGLAIGFTGITLAAPTVAINNTNICSGSSVQLNPIVTGDPTITYLWSSIPLGFSSTIANPTLSPGSNTTYSLTITDGNGFTATDNAIVTVIPAPVAVAGPAFSTCANSGAVNITGGSSATNSTGTIWTTSGTGTFSNANSLTVATYTPSGADIAAGSVTITLVANGNAPCSNSTSSKILTINAQPVATAGSNSPRCVNGTLNLNSSGGTSYSWIGPNGFTSLSQNPSITGVTAAASGLYVVTVSNGAGCSITATTNVTINPLPTATISYAGAPFCNNLTAAQPVTITGGPFINTSFSSTPGLIINPISGAITPSTSTPGTYTVTYSFQLPATGCSNTTTRSVTINAIPTVNVGPAMSAICQAGTSAPLGGSTGGGATGGIWSSPAGGTFNPDATTLNATWTPPPAFTGTATLLLTTSGGSCGTASASKTILVNANPTVNVGPAITAFCQGGTSSALGGAIGGSALSGTWSTPAGGTFNPNATTLNATWTPPAAYNGTAILTLTTGGGPCGTTSASKNITVNPSPTVNVGPAMSPICQATSSAPLGGAVGGSALGGTWSTPAGGTFTPNAISLNATWTPPAGYSGTAVLTLTTSGGPCGTTFATKNIVVNSNPTVNVGPAMAAICQGSTSAGLGGAMGGSSTSVTWSSSAGGTFNPNATTLNATWTPPASYSGTATLTLTSSGGSCGSATASKNIIVNPRPVVSISADYCIVPGKVRLTASSTVPGVTYSWSTSPVQTTQSIDVDIVGSYTVTATAAGCSGTASINVSSELVVNGNFTSGNTGFTSNYQYWPDIGGNSELVPDNGNNGYSVGTSGQNFHGNFWGIDHTANTSGPRNFMLVNGHDNITVWQETVNVIANTNYYFSAWAMSLNNSGPYARLQFQVNGVLVGSIANLGPGATSNAQAAANDHWVRFYSTPLWNSGAVSGPITIRIINLETSHPGNDFALDDISFGTLSSFLYLTSPFGTDGQTVCENTPITNIAYSYGSPSVTVSGLPPGVTVY